MSVSTLLVLSVLLVVVVIVLRTRLGKPPPVTRPRAAVGQKLQWLACKTEQPERVTRRLLGDSSQRVDWGDGFVRGRLPGMAFVTPPVKGWVLVVFGGELPPTALAALSRDLECEVQHFLTDEAVGLYAAARASGGVLTRALRVAQGVTERDEGEPDEAERAAGIVGAQGREPRHIDRASILALAARWSVNPKALAERSLPPGWVGESRLHGS
jgi:hypothetical protein